jgi:uncharacterized protein
LFSSSVVERALNRRGKGKILPLQGGKKTSQKGYCVFNKTRESFLSLSVAAADTHLARLKGLLGRLRLKSDEGIWVVPSQGVHTIGVLVPLDLIYLDSDHRVIHMVESLGSFRIGPIRRNAASVLELPARTIYSSQTQVGDQLLICPPEQMEAFLKVSNQGTEAAAG